MSYKMSAHPERDPRGRARRRGAVSLISICLTVVALSACGSSSSSSDSSSSSSGSSTTTSSCPSGVSTALAGFTAPLRDDIPQNSFNMSSLRGKTVWFISTDQSNPFIAAISQGFTAAAKAAGLKPVIFDGKGLVSGYNQGLQEAVAQHAAGIILQGVDPNLVSQPYKAALAAKIPMVDAYNGGPQDPLDGLFAHVTTDSTTNGQEMADYVLSEDHCKPTNFILFTSTVYHELVEIGDAAQAEIAKYCPKCTVTLENVDPSTESTASGPLAQTVSRRYPSSVYWIVTYDALAEPIIAGLDQLPSTPVKIVSQDGLPENLSDIAKGNVQAADILYPSTPWAGWAEIDQLGRAMTNSPPDPLVVPGQLVTKANLNLQNPYPDFGDYQQAFEKVWQ
jgi:ribose transport system substrate-binding protein